MARYKITCKDCKGVGQVSIDEYSKRVKWEQLGSIISIRFRLDNQWGFECICGNDDRMTDQEKTVIKDYANPPQPKEIKEIVKNLVEQTPKFEMIGV